MNILFIYENAINPMTGGVERITFLLANYLESNRCSVFFMSLLNPFSTSDDRQVFLPDPTNPTSDQNIAFYLKFLAKNSIDVVINKSGTNADISKLSFHCKPIGVKLISVVHNSLLGSVKHYSSTRKSKFNRLHLGFLLPFTDLKLVKHFMLQMYKFMYSKHYVALCRLSDLVILESEKFKQELAFLVDNSRLNNVIGISNFLSIDRAPIEEKRKEVLYVGRINTSQKRVDLLLNIWSLVHKQFPDWSLRIVGGGEEFDFVKELSARLELRNVQFFGYQDAKPYYESASVICLTSSYEGFGISLIEAMSRGVVPVAFNSYLSVTDIVDDKVNGFLATPFDIQEYAEILASLMSSKEILGRCSLEAVQSVEKFDLSIIGKKWLSIIND